MFKNYFKVMIRNTLKRKAFALINLFGLATGMAICLLLLLYIQNELGYDNFHLRGDQIYRLALERKYPGRSFFTGSIPQSIGQAIKKEFPEVLESTRLIDFDYSGAKVAVGDKSFAEKAVIMADSNFFRVFSGSFLQGDPGTALQKPGTGVLNETTAKKYFGSDENAMGKVIVVDGFRTCTISGVCRDWPEKSHFQFNILMTTSGMNGLNKPDYVYFGPYDYLLLNKNASAAALEAKLPLIVDKYVSGTIAGLFGEPYDKFIAEGNGYRYFLQPLKKIHLNSEFGNELRPSGSMRALVLFGVIGSFILFLACVNFINLSTALSVERAREVGIRKTFGSRKRELMGQFLSESVLFSLSSMLFALLLAFLFTPLLNKISGGELTFIYFLDPFRLLLVFGFSILVGLAAGLYPAFVLSSFDPLLVMKGRFKSNRIGTALRNGLVIFQFAISVILMICTIVVNQQMQYVLGDQLGFKRDHIISVEGIWHLRNTFNSGGPMVDNRQSFVDEISKMAGVEDITECSDLPGNDDSGGGATWVALENNASRTQRILQVDDRYQKLLDLQLIKGRFFSKAFPTDSLSLVLNEQAVADFGLKNPIGSRIISKESNFNPLDGKGQFVFTVIGVVKDFHFQSLHKKIAPLIFVNSNKFGWGSAGVRIKGDHFKTTVSNIEKTWKQFDAKDDFRFSFLDQNLVAQYKSEKTEQRLFTLFSLLAILIACIGLFGLASYSTIQRTKEISIRKVLGAMPGNIIMILSRDFLSLVIIASLIAFPVGWWAMHSWLQNFDYRVGVSWWIFLFAGAVAVLIAMLTISYQAVKAAVANPTKSLKTE
jgi:putative ABC transport system permease protein